MERLIADMEQRISELSRLNNDLRALNSTLLHSCEELSNRRTLTDEQYQGMKLNLEQALTENERLRGLLTEERAKLRVTVATKLMCAHESSLAAIVFRRLNHPNASVLQLSCAIADDLIDMAENYKPAPETEEPVVLAEEIQC